MNATLSLDLDNKWSYMKTHGDPGWESFPSNLEIVVPRILELLDDLRLRITFFIVGQDAALEGNREVLASISHNGHEIGNHSFHHEPWLHLRSADEVDRELRDAEHAIEAATGQHPCGFRGPGFTRSNAIRSILARRGYIYDASVLSTFIGPLARAYYFRSTNLDEAQRADRRDLFGDFADGFGPNRIQFEETEHGTIGVIPVTTMPGLRIPIHVSYVLYLYSYSPVLARSYFATALTLCRLTGTAPSILLHPLDFLDDRDTPELRFFPAMNIPVESKLKLVRYACRTLSERFAVQTMTQFTNQAAEAVSAKRLTVVSSVEPQEVRGPGPH
ncbi:MAG: polysaccharide deacetylase family protein [Vulcanimicrobiaceae bacterium]